MHAVRIARAAALAATAALIALAATKPVFAATGEEAVRPIQDRWARIKYDEPEARQADQYGALAVEARKVVESNPGQAEPLVWEGIALSSQAGAKGGLGALSLAKEAKARFEQAMKIDEKALGGSALTSLGTLYAKVPGWPIGFGDKDKAEELFRKSLAMNPTGIDANFFYGEYLADQGRTREARGLLKAALAAPARPGREKADAGRRKEIQALLDKLDKSGK